MSQSTSADSVAVFGSIPRGDSDHISDRDILVAGGERDLAVGRALSRAGYAPSIYSWPQLEALARDGSLFLQHLKQESEVLFDRNDRLRRLLDSYRPLSDYGHRIVQNLELFEMTSGTANSAPLLGWAFDVLAVGFRNHAILLLANRGRYVFSHSALVAELCETHNLSAEESRMLLELRRRKREYRDRYVADVGSFEALRATQAVIERVTGANCLSPPLSAETFVGHQLARVQGSSHWYYPLRRLEGVHRAMGFTPATGLPPVLRQMEQLFATPSPYGGSGSESIEWIRNSVEAIAAVWMRQRQTPSAA